MYLKGHGETGGEDQSVFFDSDHIAICQGDGYVYFGQKRGGEHVLPGTFTGYGKVGGYNLIGTDGKDGTVVFIERNGEIVPNFDMQSPSHVWEHGNYLKFYKTEERFDGWYTTEYILNPLTLEQAALSEDGPYILNSKIS